MDRPRSQALRGCTPDAGPTRLSHIALHPVAASFLLSLLVLVLAQWRWVWTPPYHDALTNWDAAAQLARHPWFPFLAVQDTGHPPLMAWALAVLWRVGAPPLVAMHVLAWLVGSLFVASVVGVAYRLGGRWCAWAAGTMALAHPVVFAQALQFNLDLPVAAFSWLAVWAAVEGRRRLLILALVLAAFSKLTGAATLLAFAAFAATRAWNAREPAARIEAAKVLLPPLAAFLLYHVFKTALVGHVFDSGEFAAGRQLALVDSPLEYASRLKAVAMRTLEHNGNGPVVLVGAALAALVALIRPARFRTAAWWNIGLPGAAAGAPVWQPATNGHAVLLAAMLAAAHALLAAAREVPPLVRYFIVCYPALWVVLLGAAAALLGSRPRGAALAAGLAAAALFAAKVHPAIAAGLPAPARRALANPPAGVPTNLENSLEFVDGLALARQAAESLQARSPRPAVRAPWPYFRYLYDPAFGFVSEALAPPENGGGPGVVLVCSTVEPPGAPAPPGALRRGRVWIDLRPDKPATPDP